ncbi:MAG: VCBS repeat-containing protein [Sphingobacteriales bacterium]|nr:VCBS repeat-containing protein [Sphingobacteriales bacterium]
MTAGKICLLPTVCAEIYGIDSIKKYQQSNPQQQIKIDELLKALPSVPLSNYLYHNKGNLVFENIAADWGLGKPNFTNGCAYADLDNDGDLDLVMNHLDELSVIYRNNAQNQQAQNNYLRIRLEGDGKNPNGIGSVVKITLPDGSQQIRNLMPTRGYLSTVEPYLHFGLGKETAVAKIEIFWANGKYQMMEDLKANQAASFKIAEAQGSAPPTTSPKPLFENITTATVQHFSPENDYIDFKREPLLPHKFSQGGPNLSGGDVNGDGLQDFFVGGCKGQAGAIYLQQKNGKFERSKANTLTFAADSSYEDAESLLLDTDQDGDLDLYVVSGGNEYEAESPFYQDRLYINDGKGNFGRSTQPLPKTIHSGACIAAHDIDGDGDLDLFRGGKVISGQYPLPPRSYLLRNDQGIFTDITEQAAPALKKYRYGDNRTMG